MPLLLPSLSRNGEGSTPICKTAHMHTPGRTSMISFIILSRFNLATMTPNGSARPAAAIARVSAHGCQIKGAHSPTDAGMHRCMLKALHAPCSWHVGHPRYQQQLLLLQCSRDGLKAVGRGT